MSHSGVLKCLISDHYAIHVCRKKGKEERSPITFSGRPYRQYDKDDILEYLSDLDWTAFKGTSDPNEQWSFMYDSLIYYLDINCPVRVFNIKKQSDPWVTPETL